MLGQLYKPKGLALQHVQAVLEAENVHACNVAWGCSNGCPMCYGPKVAKCSMEEWMKVRHPKVAPVESIIRQLEAGFKTEGVFLSFMTDPFLPENIHETEAVIELLLKLKIPVATSSKISMSDLLDGVRSGMTLLSLDQEFWQRYEPRARSPQYRIRLLKVAAELGKYTWVSWEPAPCPDIWKQDLSAFLEEIKSVKFIVAGKWNYDKRASTNKARQDYILLFNQLADFCKSNNIRLYIKPETINWIEKGIRVERR